MVQAPASAVSVSVTSNLNPIAQGQVLVLTATVSDGGVGAAPTGTVSFYNGATLIGTGSLAAGVTSSMGATVGITTLTIPNVATTAALDPRSAPAPLWAGGSGALAGVLLLGIFHRRRKWWDLLGLLIIGVFTTGIGCGGGSGNSSSTSSGGTGTTSTLAVGSSTIVARYGGDTNYATAASNGYLLTVNATSSLLPSITTAALSASSTSSAARIIATITVSGSSGHIPPTGSIDILSLGKDLEKISLAAGTGPTSTATIFLDSQSLLQGTNLFTLQYSGDIVYQSSSTNFSISNPLSDFIMAAQTPTISVSPGNSSPDVVNFSPVNGFSSTVGLTCTAPSGLTCALNSNSMAVTQNASTMLTVSASPTTPTGSYTVVVTGVSASSTIMHNVAIGVAVQ